jgi:hypothetical protein
VCSSDLKAYSKFKRVKPFWKEGWPPVEEPVADAA